MINQNLIRKCIIDTTLDVFDSDDHLHERTWASEIMYRLYKLMPEEVFLHAEVPLGGGEQIDLAITDSGRNILCGIEVKGTYDSKFPAELSYRLESNKKLYDWFLSYTKHEVHKTNGKDDRIHPPVYSGNSLMHEAVYRKFLQNVNQYNRLVKMEIPGFIVFADHSDDYSIRRNTCGIPEKMFKDNFKFRKRIAQDMINYKSNGNVELLYFVKYNTAKGPYMELVE
ncbi:hypothetical protein [Clostridium sp.]|uniref:hypothetical protein n=1 Tax=Clostridium sp. TaxID=1506 RepID=UPI00283D5D2D|nr:hypothetical protein [Clostridium sp.]MDR3596509.1 hypothetical protein [Clostridium sp.]